MQSPENAAAGFGTRWAAYVIDCLLVGILSCFVTVPAAVSALFSSQSVWNRQVLFDLTVCAIVVYAIRAVYFVIFTYAFGKTPGKMLLRIQVESVDGKKLTFVNVLFRETVGRFLSGILYIGYLLALAGKEHYALHDMLCDTRVCYTNLAEVVRIRPVILQGGPMPQNYAGQNGQTPGGSGPMPQNYAGQNGQTPGGSGPMPQNGAGQNEQTPGGSGPMPQNGACQNEQTPRYNGPIPQIYAEQRIPREGDSSGRFRMTSDGEETAPREQKEPEAKDNGCDSGHVPGNGETDNESKGF